jgi:nicotinic acid mononucleotide adenylyltransferase
LLRRRGVDLDPVRLEETVAAERSREKRDFAEYRDRVEMLALASRRSRRAAEVAEWAWRRNPNSDTLAEAKAAQQACKAAVEALREICLDDEQMISDVQRRYGR